MKTINDLIDGYAKFAAGFYTPGNEAQVQELAEGQHPKVCVVACSDSRVDPSTILNADPGDIFAIRNVANLVPPYQKDDRTLHGTSAALEFAVKKLEVEHIITIGHSGCGGINALVNGVNEEGEGGLQFMRPWVEIAAVAKDKVCNDGCHHTPQERASACEREALLVSRENLMSFPWIAKRVEEGKLQIHSWHFDIGTGKLTGYNPESKEFEVLAEPPKREVSNDTAPEGGKDTAVGRYTNRPGDTGWSRGGGKS